MRVLFFGCLNQVGHHLFDEQSQPSKDNPTPWNNGQLDPPSDRRPSDPSCALLARDVWMANYAQAEGEAVLSRRGGWTRLGWADRSIDGRRGSHANILAEGDHTFEQMLELGRRHFPKVMARLRYQVVLGK